ncbi:MAG: serine hydrolase domain-containing protein [Nocardioides sp.]
MTPDHWQRRIESWQSHGRLPSVVAGVLREGEPAWVGSAGEVPGDPADVQYRIGSITKTFVAVAVLQCRDEGLLGLDDRLARFVPESGYADSTLQSLLAHTSGMQSEPVGSWWERSPGVELTTLMERNDGSGAVAGAGDYFHYSNLGFALLGEVVARVRGASWWEVVQQRLLAPLGLERTSYDAVAPHAQGHSVDHFRGTLTREPHQDTGAMAPAGQLWSTVTDLARWARFLAEGHPDVLGLGSMREMATPVPPADDYGLGLRVLRPGGRTLVGHTGGMPGFLASIFVDPATRDGFVVLTNATTGFDADTHPLALLCDEPVAASAPWVPTEQMPTEVAAMPGLWFWGNTAVEARWHNGTLELHDLALHLRAEVFELRDGRLVGVDGYHRGETLHVVRRDDGSVSHLECATFVYTRVPYDPGAPIPGGRPS